MLHLNQYKLGLEKHEDIMEPDNRKTKDQVLHNPTKVIPAHDPHQSCKF